ncbi:glycosyltransferase family 2 protein [Pedobacter immunditicola]|uniref:glycosyltransferase family 2 protein n=1 Tax=Pedobacter immunditicola TaxID=3133440 RepID=UPI0030963167
MQIKNNVTVALLISTYNWPEALELVLLSVLKQTHLPDEIVIADDGSTAETKALIERYRSKFNIPVKHIWHEDKGFRKSLILNIAVKSITSEYIIQIDGDIIIHPEFIKDHLKVAEKGSFIQASRTMINKEKSKEILKTKEIHFNFLSKGLYSRFNALRIPFLSTLFQLDFSNTYHIKGCNLSYWKENFKAVNGYYNAFEGWGAEDYEFGARLIHADVKRKKVKMMALGYHIFHRINSRSNVDTNDKIYKKTLEEKSKYTNDGYEQV